mmetsp:Transcript_25666/g.75966  ORF Transcript_25666/g.75966 Transcript_25666/m.75966 type:complete len:558 (-) Transcript_25666:390-2063(-)
MQDLVTDLLPIAAAPHGRQHRAHPLLRLAGGVLVRVRDGAGEAVLRGRQDARLRVIVALPRQLADGRVAEPHVDVGHGVGALDALEVAGEHLVQQVGRLVEPVHQRPLAAVDFGVDDLARQVVRHRRQRVRLVLLQGLNQTSGHRDEEVAVAILVPHGLVLGARHKRDASDRVVGWQPNRRALQGDLGAGHLHVALLVVALEQLGVACGRAADDRLLGPQLLRRQAPVACLGLVDAPVQHEPVGEVGDHVHAHRHRRVLVPHHRNELRLLGHVEATLPLEAGVLGELRDEEVHRARRRALLGRELGRGAISALDEVQWVARALAVERLANLCRRRLRLGLRLRRGRVAAPLLLLTWRLRRLLELGLDLRVRHALPDLALDLLPRLLREIGAVGLTGLFPQDVRLHAQQLAWDGPLLRRRRRWALEAGQVALAVLGVADGAVGHLPQLLCRPASRHEGAHLLDARVVVARCVVALHGAAPLDIPPHPRPLVAQVLVQHKVVAVVVGRRRALGSAQAHDKVGAVVVPPAVGGVVLEHKVEHVRGLVTAKLDAKLQHARL